LCLPCSAINGCRTITFIIPIRTNQGIFYPVGKFIDEGETSNK
jgi:hypothetical protein